MKRVCAILFIVALAATLSGCLSMLEPYLTTPESLTGRWNGTVIVTDNDGPSFFPISIVVVELTGGHITGSMKYGDVWAISALEGVHTGDSVRLLIDVDEWPNLALDGTISGEVISGSVSSPLDSAISGEWEVTRVE